MTLTLHPTLAGLLRAICEDPADDDVRLILADWYEENGQAERGEFVRVQIELAKIGGRCLKRLLSTEAFEPLTYCCRACDLRRRERELRDAHGRAWLEPLARLVEPSVKDWAGWSQRCVDAGNGQSLWFEWHRGFPAEVSCTMADWCGAECDCTARIRVGPCLTFHGTGRRIGACGPAIVRAAPIERVTLTDAVPEYVGGIWTWRPATLPDFISRLIPVLDLNPPGWPTEQVATQHLSHAALAWARRQAGLPALS